MRRPFIVAYRPSCSLKLRARRHAFRSAAEKIVDDAGQVADVEILIAVGVAFIRAGGTDTTSEEIIYECGQIGDIELVVI
jgi:hypothetical protein